ncbi:hypothetical protein EB061_11365, partial [bacterium]|nr:hypothetical protein [bacterium]
TTSDADGTTAFTYAYAWRVNGSAIGASGSTLTSASFDRDDTVACLVTPNDGSTSGSVVTSNTVTVRNTAPTLASVSITPAAPTRASTLTCTPAAASDADGDSVAYTYAWTVDGVASGSASTLAGPFSAGEVAVCTVTPTDGLAYRWTVNGVAVAATGSTLSGATYFGRGDRVAVTVTPSDADGAGSAVTSASVTVSNSAPTVPVVEVAPEAASAGDDLTCTVTTAATDADGDPITYTFAWDTDGAAYTRAVDRTTSSTVPGTDVGWEQTWTCDAVATDGTATSATVSDSVSTACRLGSESSCAATSCRDILDAGDSAGDGVYYVDPDGSGAVAVYCDMTSDGGGWILVYVNANNWGSTTAHTITLASTSSPSYRWYDSTWRVTAVRSASRLGTTWDGAYPLEPEEMGAIDVKSWYSKGFQSVRYEFERGSDGASQSGWCDTSSASWNWSAGMTGRYSCKRSAPYGSGHRVSMSGVGDVCDGSGWNTGWTM